MAHSADPAAVRRRRWPLFLPFALVVLLAVVWTALWFYAAARADTEIAAGDRVLAVASPEVEDALRQILIG